jgi:hypothetical protein
MALIRRTRFGPMFSDRLSGRPRRLAFLGESTRIPASRCLVLFVLDESESPHTFPFWLLLSIHSHLSRATRQVAPQQSPSCIIVFILEHVLHRRLLWPSDFRSSVEDDTAGESYPPIESSNLNYVGCHGRLSTFIYDALRIIIGELEQGVVELDRSPDNQHVWTIIQPQQ